MRQPTQTFLLYKFIILPSSVIEGLGILFIELFYAMTLLLAMFSYILLSNNDASSIIDLSLNMCTERPHVQLT